MPDINYNIAHDQDLTEKLGLAVTERMNNAMKDQVRLRNFRNRQELIRHAVQNYLQSVGVYLQDGDAKEVRMIV